MKKLVLTLLAVIMGTAFQFSSARDFELALWDNCDRWADQKDASLHVFLADEPTGMALLTLPGGGYEVISSAGPDVAAHLVKQGISVFVLKYRLPAGRNEVPLADAEQAMRVIRSHALEWGVNPKKVGVMGNSAGGHLAASLATLYGSLETRPDFQVLLYPVITMNEKTTHRGTRDNLLGKNPTKELVEKYSLELQVTEQTPPAFIVVSAADDIVPASNSLVYASSLIEKKVPVSLHVYPDGYHGFGYSLSFKDADIWHKEFLRWLKKEVK